MFRRLCLLPLLMCPLWAHAQMLNAGQFPGLTVGDKVLAAQTQGCIAGMACSITVPADLSVWPTGAMPTRCANCTWLDYRTPGSLSITGLSLNTISALNNIPATIAQAGSDLGARINAAKALLPATGGVIDARGEQGAVTWSTAVTLGTSTQPIMLQLPCGATITFSATIVVGPSSAMVGCGSTVTQTAGTQLIASGLGASADGIDITGAQNGIHLSNFALNMSHVGRHAIKLDNTINGRYSDLYIKDAVSDSLLITSTNGGGSYWNRFETIRIEGGGHQTGLIVHLLTGPTQNDSINANSFIDVEGISLTGDTGTDGIFVLEAGTGRTSGTPQIANNVFLNCHAAAAIANQNGFFFKQTTSFGQVFDVSLIGNQIEEINGVTGGNAITAQNGGGSNPSGIYVSGNINNGWASGHFVLTANFGTFFDGEQNAINMSQTNVSGLTINGGGNITDSSRLLYGVYTSAGVVIANPHVVQGTAALVSGTPSTVTVTLSSAAVFTSSASYLCQLTQGTNQANSSLKVVNTDGSHFVITGPSSVTDTINFRCLGT
jgi:hypothetical protein